MTGYELVFITDPSHNNDELASVLKNFKKILTKSGGKLIHEYVWGRRLLAYEISGNDFGVIMPGTSQAQEKQLTNYSAKLVILMMFCVIKL